MSSTEKGDAETTSDLIVNELTKVELSTDKILSKMYDVASVMSGKDGGVQKLLQKHVGRVVPYVHPARVAAVAPVLTGFVDILQPISYRESHMKEPVILPKTSDLGL